MGRGEAKGLLLGRVRETKSISFSWNVREWSREFEGELKRVDLEHALSILAERSELINHIHRYPALSRLLKRAAQQQIKDFYPPIRDENQRTALTHVAQEALRKLLISEGEKSLTTSHLMRAGFYLPHVGEVVRRDLNGRNWQDFLPNQQKAVLWAGDELSREEMRAFDKAIEDIIYANLERACASLGLAPKTRFLWCGDQIHVMREPNLTVCSLKADSPWGARFGDWRRFPSQRCKTCASAAQQLQTTIFLKPHTAVDLPTADLLVELQDRVKRRKFLDPHEIQVCLEHPELCAVIARDWRSFDPITRHLGESRLSFADLRDVQQREVVSWVLRFPAKGEGLRVVARDQIKAIYSRV